MFEAGTFPPPRLFLLDRFLVRGHGGCSGARRARRHIYDPMINLGFLAICCISVGDTIDSRAIAGGDPDMGPNLTIEAGTGGFRRIFRRSIGQECRQ
jgi:hypothetical protein